MSTGFNPSPACEPPLPGGCNDAAQAEPVAARLLLGCVLPSLAAAHRAEKRARERPPDVSPLRDRSTFSSDVEFKQYMTQRRKAKERFREFNRLPRNRTGRDQSKRSRPAREREQLKRSERRDAAEEAKLEAACYQRQIQMGVSVPVGRKKAPPLVEYVGAVVGACK